MELLLLGTGAAEGIPAFHGACRVCKHARQHGGKEVRTRSGALLDGTIKIDLPPDTLHQMHRHRIDAGDWSALLFTHSDDDHFAYEQLQYALYPFSDMDHLGFTVYGNANVVAKLRERYPEWPMEFVLTRSFCSFNHGPYEITPIRAKHMCGEDAHNFVFRARGKTLIYATDTGVWDQPTWQFLRDCGADALVIECTQGLSPSDYEGHLDMGTCLQVIARLRSEGGLKPDAKVITTHHSHRGNATHAELEEAFKPHGFQVGYDGMTIDI